MSVTNRGMFQPSLSSNRLNSKGNSRKSRSPQAHGSKSQNLDNIRLLKQFSRKEIDIKHNSKIFAMDKRLFGQSAKYIKSTGKKSTTSKYSRPLPPVLSKNSKTKGGDIGRFIRTKSEIINHENQANLSINRGSYENNQHNNTKYVTSKCPTHRKNLTSIGGAVSVGNFNQRHKTWAGPQTNNRPDQSPNLNRNNNYDRSFNKQPHKANYRSQRGPFMRNNFGPRPGNNLRNTSLFIGRSRDISPNNQNLSSNEGKRRGFHRAETLPVIPIQKVSDNYQNINSPEDYQLNPKNSRFFKDLEVHRSDLKQNSLEREIRPDNQRRLFNKNNQYPQTNNRNNNNNNNTYNNDNRIYSQSQTQLPHLPQPGQIFGGPGHFQNRSASYTDIGYDSHPGIDFQSQPQNINRRDISDLTNFEFGQTMNRSLLLNLENNSVGMEDMENRLILLFRKIIVFSSKIESLKKKIFKKNADFSIYELFRQFAGRGALRIDERGLVELFATFDFHFSDLYVRKFILMLKGTSKSVQDSMVQNDVLGGFYLLFRGI